MRERIETSGDPAALAALARSDQFNLRAAANAITAVPAFGVPAAAALAVAASDRSNGDQGSGFDGADAVNLAISTVTGAMIPFLPVAGLVNAGLGVGNRLLAMREFDLAVQLANTNFNVNK